jgi:hypothetical protein
MNRAITEPSSVAREKEGRGDDMQHGHDDRGRHEGYSREKKEEPEITEERK